MKAEARDSPLLAFPHLPLLPGPEQSLSRAGVKGSLVSATLQGAWPGGGGGGELPVAGSRQGGILLPTLGRTLLHAAGGWPHEYHSHGQKW